MALLLPLILIAYVVLYALAFSIPSSFAPLSKLLSHDEQPPWKQSLIQKPLKNTLDAWIEREEEIALEKLLANIAPGGRNVQDAIHGSVIASPSREHPDYYFQWIRDAAITTSTLVTLYASNPTSAFSPNLTTILNAFANLQKTLQQTPNPSGTFASNLSGIGEPKFHSDGSAYMEPWGRPQHDGPALRAITLISYLRAYNTSHPELWPRRNDPDSSFKDLYEPAMPVTSVIKADLEYVSRYWNESGFDIWEEIQGLHFFTAMVQRRALCEGANLAVAFGDSGAAEWYDEQASHLEDLIDRFWNEEKGHLVETLDSHDRSGLDCALLLGSLHGYPSDSSAAEPIYPPHSDKILISLLSFINDQKHRFPINSIALANLHSPSSDDEFEADAETFEHLHPTALGRYPEDTYNGYTTSASGNPWFLCTTSAASILYHTILHLSSTSNLTITPLSYPFYASLLASSSLTINPKSKTTYGPNDAVFHSVLERLKGLGDGFLEIVQRHATWEGALSEQFDAETGFERGARDLTWSYGAFLDAVRVRGRLGF